MDSSARYRAHNLPPGEYAVGLWVIGIPGYVTAQLYPNSAQPRLFKIFGGETFSDVDFRIAGRQQFHITGKLEGMPKPVPFSVALGLPDRPEFTVATRWTEVDGSFRFDGIPAGEYVVYASGPAGGYGAFETMIAESEPALFAKLSLSVTSDIDTVTLPLQHAQSVRARLRMKAGAPVPAGCGDSMSLTYVLLEPWGILPMGINAVRFTGDVSISNLPPGKIRLSAQPADPKSSCFPVTEPVMDISSGDNATAWIDVAAAGRIEGQVKAADKVVVLLDPADNRVAFPDKDGKFIFNSLAPGTHKVGLLPADGQSRWSDEKGHATSVNVPGGGVAQVVLEP